MAFRTRIFLFRERDSTHTYLPVRRLRVSKRGISPVRSVSEISDTDPEAHLRATLSEADRAITHLSDPTTLTATSEKETRKGFPSAVPE